MTKTLLALAVCAGSAFAWASGCGDPNPPLNAVKNAGSTGGAIGSGGAMAATGGKSGSTGGATGSGGLASSGGVSGSGGEATSSGGAGGAAGGVAGKAGPGGGGAAVGGAVGGAPGMAGRMGGGAGNSGMGGGPALMVAEVIDDFEDGDGRLEMTSGRQGPWHSFNDSGNGNQTPPLNTTLMPEMGGANMTMFAAHTKGSGYKFGGVGFDLNNATTTPESMMCMSFDGSAFKGLSFWAKGDGNLRVELPMKSFVPTSRGGSCDESKNTCWNVYGSRSPQKMLTTDWKQFVIPFSALERDDGSKTPAFDPSQLMGISFKSESSSFDFWIDEVAFAK